MGMIVLRITFIFSSTKYCFDVLKELTVKIKTAGWYIFLILYDKQDDMNYRLYNVF